MESQSKNKKKIFKPNIGKGDYGFTEFIGTAVAYKSSWQAETCGTIDELNTVIGEAHARIDDPVIRADLFRVSRDLFVLGSDVASTIMSDKKIPRIQTRHVHYIEERIVEYELLLSPIRHFIIPMGPPTVTILNQARAVCRRTERQMVRYLKDAKKKEKVNPLTLAYLNRLGDLLFSIARHVMKKTNTPEIYWSREDAEND